MKKYSLLCFSMLIIACNDHSKEKDAAGTRDTTSVKADTAVAIKKRDTVFEYRGVSVQMKVREGGKVIKTCIFNYAGDTVYYGNGKPQYVTAGESPDFNSMQYEYYSNGKLKRVAQQGMFSACGIQVGEELNYDSLGNMISRSTFEHNLPARANGCHDTHTVITTTEYYSSGVIKLKKKEETFYEGETCDCGTWEYYDDKGKLVKKEKHESCYDDKLSCAQ